jgi:hypothetical protein
MVSFLFSKNRKHISEEEWEQEKEKAAVKIFGDLFGGAIARKQSGKEI